MAWYVVSLNILFAVVVLGTICGSQLWAIAKQGRDWPEPRRDVARQEASRESEPARPLGLEPALS